MNLNKKNKQKEEKLTFFCKKSIFFRKNIWYIKKKL